MKQAMRGSVLALTVVTLGLTGCARAVRDFVNSTPVGTARSAVYGASVASELADMRETPSPIGGTYRVTATLPTGEDVVFYARTTDKATMPFMRAEAGVEGLAGWQETGSHVLLAHAALTREGLADSVEEMSSEDEATTTGWGVVLVAKEPQVQGDSTEVYEGQMMLELAPGQTPAADRYREAIETYKHGEEARDVESSTFPGRFRLTPGGSAMYEGVLRVDGEPLLAVRAERIANQRIPN